jgi:hypothetical protein
MMQLYVCIHEYSFVLKLLLNKALNFAELSKGVSLQGEKVATPLGFVGFNPRHIWSLRACHTAFMHT